MSKPTTIELHYNLQQTNKRTKKKHFRAKQKTEKSTPLYLSPGQENISEYQTTEKETLSSLIHTNNRTKRLFQNTRKQKIIRFLFHPNKRTKKTFPKIRKQKRKHFISLSHEQENKKNICEHEKTEKQALSFPIHLLLPK